MGKVAGAKAYDDGEPKGIVVGLRYNGRKISFAAQRLIWMLVTGNQIPYGMVVDHKNRNPFDNRLSNLRLASFAQNSQNTIHPNGKMLRGVRKCSSKFGASICFQSKIIWIGTFKTELEAHKAYMAKSIELRKEYHPHE